MHHSRGDNLCRNLCNLINSPVFKKLAVVKKSKAKKKKTPTKKPPTVKRGKKGTKRVPKKIVQPAPQVGKRQPKRGKK